MKAGRLWVPVAGLIGTAAATAAAALAATATSGKAIEVPGSAALNLGGNARVTSISCATRSSCAAVGYYDDASAHRQVFVANKKNGIWRNAAEVPGTAALNAGGSAGVYSISCATARSCAAGGYFTDSPGRYQAFLADKRNGVWRKAVEVPGTAGLNRGDEAEVLAISCAAAGSCAAGGFYKGTSGYQAFVVNQKHGVWGKAIEVPGSAALNLGGDAQVSSISCATASSCAASGSFYDSSGDKAFVVKMKNGVWRKAIEVPGLGALNLGGGANATTMSCPKAGSCAAGGVYTDASKHYHAFVVNEKNGVWRKAVELPGIAALNLGADAILNSISCAAAGSCAAGGNYKDGSGHHQAFVASMKNGVWRKAIEVPGAAALNLGGEAKVNSISCPKAGSCAAGGVYKDDANYAHPFVVYQRNGVWRKAFEIPGSAALNLGGNASLTSISCPTRSTCAAGGSYSDSSAHNHPFVTKR